MREVILCKVKDWTLHCEYTEGFLLRMAALIVGSNHGLEYLVMVVVCVWVQFR